MGASRQWLRTLSLLRFRHISWNQGQLYNLQGLAQNADGGPLAHKGGEKLFSFLLQSLSARYSALYLLFHAMLPWDMCRPSQEPGAPRYDLMGRAKAFLHLCPGPLLGDSVNGQGRGQKWPRTILGRQRVRRGGTPWEPSLQALSTCSIVPLGFACRTQIQKIESLRISSQQS